MGKVKRIMAEIVIIGTLAAFPLVMFCIYADAVGHPIF